MGWRAAASTGCAGCGLTFEGALGVWLYGPYRDRIKQSIFIEAPWVGLMFERKEHLALGSIFLAWAGAAAYVAAIRASDEVRRPLRVLAFRAFVVAAALAVAVAGLGTLVASFRSF